MKIKTLLLSSIAGLAALTFSSCAVTTPHAISDAKIGNKVGVSKTIVLFGTWYLNGKFGLTEAVKNGKISGGVATIDDKVTNYLFFYSKEIIVTGE